MTATAPPGHWNQVSQRLRPAVLERGRDPKTGLWPDDLGLLWQETLASSAADVKFECFS